MIDTFLKAGEYPKEFFICLLLALVPTVVWFYVFGRRHKHRWKHVLLTLFAGMCAGAFILAYQKFWGSQFNFLFFSVTPENFQSGLESQVSNIFLSALLVAFSIGFLEEYAKHWLVKMTDHGIFESIDDVIEFSIIGALGFAFLENIGYFFGMIVSGNTDGLVTLFVLRSVIVVFVHILCSGIYGYYYGLGYFAKPILEKREKEGKMPFFPVWIHRCIHLKKDQVFKDQTATLGLIIAVGIHGIYDFLMGVGTLGGLAEILGFSGEFSGAHIQIHVLLFPPLLFFGFTYLSYLLNKKEDQKNWGHLETREVFRSSEELAYERVIR